MSGIPVELCREPDFKFFATAKALMLKRGQRIELRS